MRILKEVRVQTSCCSAERIEAITIQCTFVIVNLKRKESAKVIVFPNVFENLFIHETILSVIFWKFASFRSRMNSRFLKPRISTVFRRAQKNTSKSLGSLPKTESSKNKFSYKATRVLRSLPFSVEWYHAQ